jgi:hypothetical protein
VPIKGNTDIEILYIEQAAHHLDLREPNDEHDPQSVKDARARETLLIRQWINEYMGKQ